MQLLNLCIPTAILGGLLGLREDQMNDPLLWARIVTHITQNKDMADTRIITEAEEKEREPEVREPIETAQQKVARLVEEIKHQRSGRAGREQREVTVQNEEEQGGEEIGNREVERETFNPPLIDGHSRVMGRVPFQSLNPREENVVREEEMEFAVAPEVGMALAGCAVQFTPRGSKSKIPKHMDLPTHSRLPPTDLMEFFGKTSRLCNGWGLFGRRIYDPNSARDFEGSGKNLVGLRKGI